MLGNVAVQNIFLKNHTFLRTALPPDAENLRMELSSSSRGSARAWKRDDRLTRRVGDVATPAASDGGGGGGGGVGAASPLALLLLTAARSSVVDVGIDLGLILMSLATSWPLVWFGFFFFVGGGCCF